jgi:hypothetical protein
MARREALIHALARVDLPGLLGSENGAGSGGDGGQQARIAACTAVVDGLIEQGLVQDEPFEAEVQRLRDRIHEVTNECQRRYAAYVSRCERFDVWSAWARAHFAHEGDQTWTHGSQANRLLIMSLMEERDAAKDEVRALKVEKYTDALEWLTEGDHYALMLAQEPELMARLRQALFGR